MKFMLIMRSTAGAKAAQKDLDFEAIINAMGAYNEAMMTAGVLVSGEGLADDTANAFVVSFDGAGPTVSDGLYGETHELFNGYWIIEVANKAEAIEWASRCPMSPGTKLEVRRLSDMSDFEGFEDNEFIQKEEGWREELGQS
ncbi:MAG: YciI family protein [Terrimesophilobacter sp.]